MDTGRMAARYQDKVENTEPLLLTWNARIIYSDSGIIRAKLSTPLMHDYTFKDGIMRTMPSGLTVYLFEVDGKEAGTLVADSGVIHSQREEVSAYGRVIFVNPQNEQLRTSELHFNTNTYLLFTDAFVTLQKGDEVLYGQGLEATDKFSKLKIRKPMGQFFIEDAD